MPGPKRKGGRMSPKTFHEEVGSVDQTFEDLSPELQEKYHQNRLRHLADAKAMERWASGGFESGIEESPTE
jgi:hypothetical protein